MKQNNHIVDSVTFVPVCQNITFHRVVAASKIYIPDNLISVKKTIVSLVTSPEQVINSRSL